MSTAYAGAQLMRFASARRIVLAASFVSATTAPNVHAYSVLAHEAMVDSLWTKEIVPLLQQRFPSASSADLVHARAFAYGGAVIQDLGYYPFGSRLFTNLVHYVRSGDFIEALIHEARDVNEYAFAIGALAHYAADTSGHPEAVNRAVPIVYPKLRAKYGDRVTYVQSPTRHILVEFAFDVVQVAGGAYTPDAYHGFIGFEVAKPVLERAFRQTYGLEMKDLFLDEDLAIGSYRFALGKAVPHITKVAWDTKREEIERLTPGVERAKFVFALSRSDYEAQFGTEYKRPGFLVRILGFFYRLVPRVGPFRVLSFKAPTPEAEHLFVDSFADAKKRLEMALESMAHGRLDLRNVDFDTGQPTERGEYALADETYADLLHELASRKFKNTPEPVRQDISRFFNSGTAPADSDGDSGGSSRRTDRKRAERIRRELAELGGSS